MILWDQFDGQTRKREIEDSFLLSDNEEEKQQDENTDTVFTMFISVFSLVVQCKWTCRDDYSIWLRRHFSWWSNGLLSSRVVSLMEMLWYNSAWSRVSSSSSSTTTFYLDDNISWECFTHSNLFILLFLLIESFQVLVIRPWVADEVVVSAGPEDINILCMKMSSPVLFCCEWICIMQFYNITASSLQSTTSLGILDENNETNRTIRLDKGSAPVRRKTKKNH
jgi:hypothetical protein